MDLPGKPTCSVAVLFVGIKGKWVRGEVGVKREIVGSVATQLG